MTNKSVCVRSNIWSCRGVYSLDMFDLLQAAAFRAAGLPDFSTLNGFTESNAPRRALKLYQ